MDTYRILAMDGGGLKSLLTARLLQRIAAQKPSFLAQTQLFSGTSAGGMMALILAASADFHVGLQQCVFLWEGVPTGTNTVWGSVRGLAGQGAFYSNTQLKAFLTDVLGNRTLGDLKNLGRMVVIPTFELDNKGRKSRPRSWQPKIFHNFGGADDPDLSERLVDVALRTSSAPVFSPIYQGYIDGGVYANNPSMCAIAQLLNEEKPLSSLRLFSVGSGDNRLFVNTFNANWGWVQWLLNPQHPLTLISLLMESDSTAVCYQCQRLLKDHFFRLDPDLNHPAHRLDQSNLITKSASIRVFNQIAQNTDLTDTFNWLERANWFHES